MESKNSGMSYLFSLMKKQKVLLTLACLFSVISGILQVIPFLSVFKIVEEFFKSTSNEGTVDIVYVRQWGFIAFIGLIGSIITLYIGGMCSHVAAFKILYRLRLSLVQHLTQIPMGYHTKTATGETKKIIETSVEKIEKFVAHQLPDLITALVIPILMIGYLFFLDWRLALVIVIAVILSFMLQGLVYLNEDGTKAFKDYQYSMEDMTATAVAFVRGMPAVKVFGIAADSFLTFKKSVDKYREISLKITNVYRVPYSLFQLLVTSLFAFVLPVGIYLIYTNSTNVAFVITLILFLIISPSLASPLMKLMYLGGGMREIIEGNNRIQALLAIPKLEEQELPLVPNNYNLSFEHVSFSYEEEASESYKEVLTDVSFTANAGEMLALVGPSGSGKSTIANLVLRFWEVTSGEICIGDAPIKQMKISTLMDIVSFVFQDIQLFYDTIEENIRMGNTTASMDEVVAAAKTACCHEFIEQLEDGYQTKIGNGGIFLSGGEAQRLAIARALLKNAPILVLDEATAYADAENEHKIQQGLAELVKGKTVMMIAHRLSTIMHAEQILVIENGQVVEKGTHQELLAENGVYTNMWQAHTSATNWKLGQENQSNTCATGGLIQ